MVPNGVLGLADDTGVPLAGWLEAAALPITYPLPQNDLIEPHL